MSTVFNRGTTKLNSPPKRLGEENDEKGKSDESLNGNGTCLCKELEGYSGDCCQKELQEGKL